MTNNMQQRIKNYQAKTTTVNSLTNSMVQNPWEANSFSAGQAILRMLSKPKFHSRSHEIPPLFHILSHISQVTPSHRMSISILTTQLCQHRPSCHVPSDFLTKTLCALFPPSVIYKKAWEWRWWGGFLRCLTLLTSIVVFYWTGTFHHYTSKMRGLRNQSKRNWGCHSNLRTRLHRIFVLWPRFDQS
jgi:hypothetical protein